MTYRSSRLASIGVGAVLLAAAFSGCGGSDDDSGELSKEDFITQANEICADFNTGSDAAEQEFNAAIQENDFETAGDLFAENASNMEASIDEFAELTPPADDQATIDEFVDLSRQQVDIANELADAIRENDDAAASAASEEGGSLDEQSDAIADEYGLTECGSQGDDSQGDDA